LNPSNGLLDNEDDVTASGKRAAHSIPQPSAKKAKVEADVNPSSFFKGLKVHQVVKKAPPPPRETVLYKKSTEVSKRAKTVPKPIEPTFDDDDLIASLPDDMLDAKTYSQDDVKPISTIPSPKVSARPSPVKELTPKPSPKKSTTKSTPPSKNNSPIKKDSPVKKDSPKNQPSIKDAWLGAKPRPAETTPIALEDDTSDLDEIKLVEKPKQTMDLDMKITDAHFFQKKGVIKMGGRAIPKGAPNCLQGLAFVLTGELPSVTRDQAADLIKMYGGRITTAASSKTNYIVAGTDAGPAKLEFCKEHPDTKLLDEEAFFNLIQTLPAKQATTFQPKTPAEKKKLERLKTPEKNASAGQLWTVKYAPKKVTDIVGHGTAVSKLQSWLRNFETNRANDFKGNSKDDIGNSRAFLISGPPGIGKTTMAHIVGESEGFQIVEFNASDTRSKKSLKDLVRELTGSHTVTEYFKSSSGSTAKNTAMKPSDVKKTLIIMDEVDGMSGGDRGGNAELIQLIKSTKVPIICICNDRQAPKVRTLANYCFDMRLRRPDVKSIAKRIGPIALQEGIQLTENLIQEVCRITQSDIRQVLNMLSTWRLSRTSVDFVQGKEMYVYFLG
jgi:replication factor C subunit 1